MGPKGRSCIREERNGKSLWKTVKVIRNEERNKDREGKSLWKTVKVIRNEERKKDREGRP